MILKQLTQNTYLISSDNGTKLGLVFNRDDNFIFTYDNEVYPSLKDIAKSIGEPIIVTKTSAEEKEETFIGDYPIKHSDYTDVKDKSYQYKNTRFMIGWWIVENARVVLSPKEATIIENNGIGPFTTKFLAAAELRRAK